MDEKYKNALAKAREIYRKTNVVQKGLLESLFPELSESEDEKIRKALIRFHKSTIDIDGIKGSEIVSWLEKQGEQLDKGEISDVWTEKDRIILEGIIDEIEVNKNEAPSYDLPTYDQYLNWLKSLKKKIKNE